MSLCEVDHSCSGGDVLAPPGGLTLQCNLFNTLEAVAVSTDTKDVEGWFDRGFLKKAYYEKEIEKIVFLRGWSHCAWSTDAAECLQEPACEWTGTPGKCFPPGEECKGGSVAKAECDKCFKIGSEQECTSQTLELAVVH